MIKIIKREPVSAPPTEFATKALYDLLAFVTEPSAEVDARIYCWMNGWTLLPKVHDTKGTMYFRDAAGVMHAMADGYPMFTYSVSEALNLVATMTPGLGLLMLQHPNGNWSVAWSDDGPPKLDNIHFDPAFLPLAIVVCVLEAMGQREARKQ